MFDKFRRLQQPSDRGEGLILGRSVPEGFVEAMEGRIPAASPIHSDHGARVLISQPRETQTHSGLL